VPIEADDRGVVADLTVARLGDRTRDASHEFVGRELLVVREVLLLLGSSFSTDVAALVEQRAETSDSSSLVRAR
jgi:hypothetical protein